MEKIIFFGLIIPIFIFIVYLGGRAIMTGLVQKTLTNLAQKLKLVITKKILILPLEI